MTSFRARAEQHTAAELAPKRRKAVLLLGLFSQPAVQMEDVLLAPYPVSGIVTIVASYNFV